MEYAPTIARQTRRATLITDASFDHRFKVGGWAAWIRADGDGGRPFCRSGPLKGPIPSSTIAEVRAALNGVWLARTQFGATHVLLQSDCSAVIDLVEGRVKAQQLLDLWRDAFTRPDMQGVLLSARHVKGHGEIKDRRTYVNDGCDRYARQHMEKERHNVRKRPRG